MLILSTSHVIASFFGNLDGTKAYIHKRLFAFYATPESAGPRMLHSPIPILLIKMHSHENGILAQVTCPPLFIFICVAIKFGNCYLCKHNCDFKQKKIKSFAIKLLGFSFEKIS